MPYNNKVCYLCGGIHMKVNIYVVRINQLTQYWWCSIFFIHPSHLCGHYTPWHEWSINAHGGEFSFEWVQWIQTERAFIQSASRNIWPFDLLSTPVKRSSNPQSSSSSSWIFIKLLRKCELSLPKIQFLCVGISITILPRSHKQCYYMQIVVHVRII